MKQNGFWKGFGSGLVLTVLIAALCVTATVSYTHLTLPTNREV